MSERHDELQAGARLKRLTYDNVEIICGAGIKGLPDKAPFDTIIVSAGGPQVSTKAGQARRRQFILVRCSLWTQGREVNRGRASQLRLASWRNARSRRWCRFARHHAR
jgi:Protein-L-isoaspartate(D-aspartate) O-methyltransferase (PCMT)